MILFDWDFLERKSYVDTLRFPDLLHNEVEDKSDHEHTAYNSDLLGIVSRCNFVKKQCPKIELCSCLFRSSDA